MAPVKDEQTVPLTHDSDDSDSEYGLHSSATHAFRQPQRRNICRAYLCTIAGYLLCAAVFTFIGAQIVRHNVDLDARCAAYTTQYSPVIKDVDIKYSMTAFNGSFMQESIYRRHASPEVDAAWEDLGVNYRAGVIPESEGAASGLSSHHVQRSQKYGGGFLVNVEGMHHLHCLNLLRKSLYFNFDYYKAMGHHAFSNNDEILGLHVTHCLDIIRQVLMCNVDTAVLGQVWSLPQHGEENVGHDSHTSGGSEDHHHDDDAHGDSDAHHDSRRRSRSSSSLRRDGKPAPQAFPDFNTNHKCKNYDAVRRWAEAHQAPPNEELPPDYLAHPQPGDVLEHTP